MIEKLKWYIFTLVCVFIDPDIIRVRIYVHDKTGKVLARVARKEVDKEYPVDILRLEWAPEWARKHIGEKDEGSVLVVIDFSNRMLGWNFSDARWLHMRRMFS